MFRFTLPFGSFHLWLQHSLFKFLKALDLKAEAYSKKCICMINSREQGFICFSSSVTFTHWCHSHLSAKSHELWNTKYKNLNIILRGVICHKKLLTLTIFNLSVKIPLNETVFWVWTELQKHSSTKYSICFSVFTHSMIKCIEIHLSLENYQAINIIHNYVKRRW